MFIFIANLFYYIIYGLIAVFIYLFSEKDVSEEFRKTYFADFFTSQWFVKWLRRMLHEHRIKWLKGFTELKARHPNEKLVIIEVLMNIELDYN